MRAEILTITPELAAQMLAANINNRPVAQAHVARLANDMKNGKWKLNGDMIRNSKKGRVLDGQHRLHAIIKAGVAIVSWVMWDVPDDVFDTIDVGKRRSTADTLSCLGAKNTSKLAAAISIIEKYNIGKAESAMEFTNTEIQELYAKYPDVGDYLISPQKTAMLLPPSILNACYYLFCKKDYGMAQEFFEKTVNGVGLQEGDPWYVLRQRLVQNSLSKSKLPRAHLMALCIYAWNHARKGNKIKVLKLNVEGNRLVSFPVIE